MQRRWITAVALLLALGALALVRPAHSVRAVHRHPTCQSRHLLTRPLGVQRSVARSPALPVTVLARGTAPSPAVRALHVVFACCTGRCGRLSGERAPPMRRLARGEDR